MMNQVRDLPSTPAGWFSLCAARYFEKYGAGREDLGRIAIKNHHNGTLAPKSFLKREITLEDYLKGRMISWPFGLYDCAAQTDGAAAAILTRSDLAKGYRDDPVLVKAVTVFAGPNPQKDPSNDFLSWKPTIHAAEAAYGQVESALRREPERSGPLSLRYGAASHACNGWVKSAHLAHCAPKKLAQMSLSGREAALPA